MLPSHPVPRRPVSPSFYYGALDVDYVDYGPPATDGPIHPNRVNHSYTFPPDPQTRPDQIMSRPNPNADRSLTPWDHLLAAVNTAAAAEEEARGANPSSAEQPLTQAERDDLIFGENTTGESRLVHPRSDRRGTDYVHAVFLPTGPIPAPLPIPVPDPNRPPPEAVNRHRLREWPMFNDPENFIFYDLFQLPVRLRQLVYQCEYVDEQHRPVPATLRICWMAERREMLLLFFPIRGMDGDRRHRWLLQNLPVLES